MPASAPVEVTTDTRQAIIDHALVLIETLGFTGFSYRDLAERLGITSASIHYHFPAKADLGVALIHRLAEQGKAGFAALEAAHSDVAQRFRARIAYLCENARKNDRMCAFGSLLSDYGQLPEAMQKELTLCEAWLHATYARWLDEGRRAGQLSFPGSTVAMAGLIACVFHGILMHHRAQRDMDVDAILAQLLRLISVT